ncbi:hypothetical protein GC167_10305 [bacterium]|nr:hypothetical protein [bacterium]
MLKRWLAFVILLSALLPRLLGDSLALMWFEGNRAYIAEVLCINQDRPELACNGQCHLAKMLEADNPSTPDSPLLPDTPEVLPFVLCDAVKIDEPLKAGNRMDGGFLDSKWADFSATPSPPPPRAQV